MTIFTKIYSFRTTHGLPALLALSIGIFCGAAVQADQVTGNTRSTQIKFADLDLTTAEGRQVAQARVHKVASTLCTRIADELDLSHHDNFVRCVDDAVAKANARLQAIISQESSYKVARAEVK